jgi:hypothetical protein
MVSSRRPQWERVAEAPHRTGFLSDGGESLALGRTAN